MTRSVATSTAWRVLGVAVTAQIGVSVIDQGMPTLTGFIKADLGISAATAGLAVSSFAAGKIFGSYAAGLAADRLGERRVLMFGALTTAALVAAASFAPLPLLFVLLFLAGIAGASSTPAGGRLVLLAFPRTRHGLALGIRQTGIPMGGLVAAAILPWVAHRSSWHWSLVVAAAIAAARRHPARAPARRSRARASRGRAARPPTACCATATSACSRSGAASSSAASTRSSPSSRSTCTSALGYSLATGSLLVAVANASGIAGRDRLGRDQRPRASATGASRCCSRSRSAGLLGALAAARAPARRPARRDRRAPRSSPAWP